jgi:hypothetical protein
MNQKEKSTLDCWQNFLVCIALHMLLPLLPLLLELWFAKTIEAKSAALTAALYSMAIGLSSRFIAILGAGFLFGFIFSAVFGYLSTEPIPALENSLTASGAAIGFIFAVHIIERYFRHVRDEEEFFEFLKRK